MTIKQVLKMGDPKLLEVANAVEQFNTSALDKLIQDMKDTMNSLDGAGLAAPQIGVGLQVVIFGFKENQRYPDSDEIPFTVLVNPHLTPLSDEMEEGWEGCLSVPGLRGKVPRYTHLRYQGFDQYGQVIDRQVESFHARVVQHECDHLQGILYPMRIRDFRTFGYTEVLFPELVAADRASGGNME
ncbi:peptide deformylase [Nitrosomonas marina]|uniref:Peptide deformylase n=1 Tax=Nitrosomonas marina TaxID=917 RepID=A0A1H8B737_9PROT|nr:peptide deformylase [Nitrosomonas marina]SEM77964.1 peptide deformylase [Nitrosomonas marina]